MLPSFSTCYLEMVSKIVHSCPSIYWSFVMYWVTTTMLHHLRNACHYIRRSRGGVEGVATPPLSRNCFLLLCLILLKLINEIVFFTKLFHFHWIPLRAHIRGTRPSLAFHTKGVEGYFNSVQPPPFRNSWISSCIERAVL